jgi:decaprenylphospho-beta-D-erythro-pentofuranosid-2-ulose 2-reductase
MSERILIVGATSAIAQAVGRLFAAEGARLFLVARNRDRLEAIAADLRVRGAVEVSVETFDAASRVGLDDLVGRAWSAFGGIDGVLVAHGSLPDQGACNASSELTLHEMDVNAMGVIGLLTPIANRMESAGAGTIAVIGSVAGDRGRQSNYVYGAAKACIDTYLQGLAHRLYPAGVRVVTVKPGFVDTPMTADFDKGPLWASAQTVAKDIRRAMQRGTPVVYTPWFWRWIMLVIRAIPRPIFYRTKL